MEGFHSVEEHMQYCIDFFSLLQQWEENNEYDEEFLLEKKDIILKKEELSDVFLPAPYMRERCGLTETEYWLVLFALACELENGLHLPFIKKNGAAWINLQYALHLISLIFPVDFTLISSLYEPDSVICDILKFSENTLQQPLHLNQSVLPFLLTGALQQEDWCEIFFPGETETNFLNIHEEEYGLLFRYLQKERDMRILLIGDMDSGKRTLLKRLLLKMERIGIFVRMDMLWAMNQEILEESYKSLRLFSHLTEAMIIMDFQGAAFDGKEDWGKEDRRLEIFLRKHRRRTTFFLLADNKDSADRLKRFSDTKVNLKEHLSSEEKKTVLDGFLKSDERRPWQDRLLDGYRLNMGELCGILRNPVIMTEADSDDRLCEKIWAEVIQDRNGISRLGKVIEGKYTLEDMVVSEECSKRLETVSKLAEVCLAQREGLNILFHGSSGTGKTMAASVIASCLHLPLFKIDLSQVVDKYIGETEKNLDEIFRTARRNNYILFFDEADVLFSKRTGVQDAHDRYANISTAYLLQSMEMYDGIVILATNLIDHFDDAFLRRIRFVIKFQNLEEEGRVLLWEKLLAGDMPASEDISPKLLAQAVNFSPARIKAVVQTAGMLAVSEGSVCVTKEHLQRALELEADKDETVIRKNL